MMATGATAAVDLLLMLVLHTVLTALPGIAVVLCAARRGVREESVLLGLGLAGGGIIAMLTFWAYYAEPTLGMAFAYLVPIASVCVVARSLPVHDSGVLERLGVPLVLWVLGAVFLVFLGFLHGGTGNPLATAASRFLPLASDAGLPYFFSEWFFKHGHDGVPPVVSGGTWLSSDRPPLQMGFALAQRGWITSRPELHYQVLGVLLQQVWIIGLWALLIAARVGRTTRGLAMLVVLVSDLAIVNGFFVWPKMLAAAFLLSAIALAATPLWEDLRTSTGGAALIAALIALAMLSHAASLFGVIPLILFVAAGRQRWPGWRWLAVAALVGTVLLVPWAAYQRYGDPPGNRLTKWMIGGFSGIDGRGALETVASGYRQAGWWGTIRNKAENFATMSGGTAALTRAGDAVKAFSARDISQGISDLRAIAFFYTLPSCGLLLIAPFAMLVARGRGRGHPADWQFALRCFALFILGCFFWGLLMFGTEDTRAVIHTGSLAVLVLAFCAAVAGLQCTYPRLCKFVVLTQVLVTLALYVPALSPGLDTSYSLFGVILMAAALLGFGVMAFETAPPLPAWIQSMAGSLPRHRLAVSLVLAVIPFVSLALLVRQYYVDVPFWDEWEIVTRLRSLHDGTFSFRDLWMQHNAHRPLFGVALVLTLVRASDWNVGVEVAANVLVGAMIAGVFVVQLVRRWPSDYRLPVWLLPLLSFFIFSPSQSENWLSGWQVTILLNVLAVTAGLALLANLDGRWSRLAGAGLCGIVATYTFAAGLVFWAAGSAAWWLSKDRRNLRQLMVWIITAGLTIASYFYDYSSPDHPAVGNNFASIHQFHEYLVYVARYIGASVAMYSPGAASVAGGLALAVFGWLVSDLRRLAGTPVFGFSVMAGIHGLGAALMTGLGRTGFGTDQGLMSRHITISTTLWLALFLLAALRLSRPPHDREEGLRPRLTVVLLSVLLVVALSSAMESAYMGALSSRARHDQLQPARRALFWGNDDALLSRLYPDVQEVKRRRELLLAWRLSVFRNARAQGE